MARPPQTAAQRQQMCDRILDTAVEILEEEGPDGLSSRAIAARLNIAHMSLYTYFENHPALLRALRDREAERWWAEQERVTQRAPGEPVLPAVEAFLSLIVVFAQQKTNLHRLAWNLAQKGEENYAESQVRQQRMVGELAGLLQEGMAAGEFTPRNPMLAAGAMLSTVNTPFILFYTGRVPNTAVRDLLVAEVMEMARLYLTKA